MNDVSASKVAIAVSQGDTEFLQQWLDAGGKPDECVCNGFLLVHVAANAGSLPSLKLLVESGASLRLPDESGYYPLHNAALASRLEIAKYLLEQDIDVDAKSKQGMTALQIVVDWWTDASNEGSVQIGETRLAIAKAIIDKRASLHVADDYGHMPLHTAARNGEMPFVELLLGAGCNPNAQEPERFGPTALAEAIITGMTDAAQRLIDAGADLNLPDTAGNTPLHAAVVTTDEQTAPQMVLFLLERGADPSIRNKEGKTAEESVASDLPVSKTFAAYRAQQAIEAVLQRASGAPVQSWNS